MRPRENTLSQPWASASAVRLILALTAAVTLTTLGLPQYITGPLVNALLLLSVMSLGIKQAVLVGLVTPLGAALRGVLPLPLLAMIPFIALGNALYVSLYALLERRQRQVGLVAAAVAKFALLYGAVTLLAALQPELGVGGSTQTLVMPPALIEMMAWPQLATALAGGLLAWGARGVHEWWSQR